MHQGKYKIVFDVGSGGISSGAFGNPTRNHNLQALGRLAAPSST